MLLPSIARKASGLPLSLLEIHTFVHVLCAIAIYGFWFKICFLYPVVQANKHKKPFDIQEAYEPKLEELDEHNLLLMYISDLKTDARELDSAGTYMHPALLCACGYLVARFTKPIHLTFLVGLWPLTVDLAGPRLERRKSREKTCCWWLCFKRAKPRDVSPGCDPYIEVEVQLDGDYQCVECRKVLDNRRKTLLFNCSTRVGRFMKLSLTDKAFGTKRFLTKKISKDGFHTRSGKRDWVPVPLNPAKAGYGPVIALILLTAAYGGIHLLALSAAFPSRGERSMWRWSSLVTAASGTVLTAMLHWDKWIGMLGLQHERDEVLSSIEVRVLRYAIKIMGYAVVAVFVPGVLFARAFLVLESFLQLRAVLVGVYAAIPRANYIPHV